MLKEFLSPGLVDALNAAIDHFAGDETKVRWSGPPGSTNGGGNRPWVVNPLGNSPLAEGTHDRGGITAPCDWPAPHCNPFRALGSHTGMLRYVLQLIGNGFRYGGSPSAFLATAGTEGHVLHSGGTGTFGDEGGTTLNMGGHMYLCQNVRPAASLRIRSTYPSAASGFGPLTPQAFCACRRARSGRTSSAWRTSCRT